MLIVEWIENRFMAVVLREMYAEVYHFHCKARQRNMRNEIEQCVPCLEINYLYLNVARDVWYVIQQRADNI